MENLVALLSEEDKHKLRMILQREYLRSYKAKHKEIIHQQDGRIVQCELCNKDVQKWNLSKHQKTWKCLQKQKEIKKLTSINQINNVTSDEDSLTSNNISEEYKSE